LETRWQQCLDYPLHAWFLLLNLAGGLAGLTGAAVLTQLAPDGPPTFLGEQQWSVLGFCLLALLALAYVCGVLQCALSSGLAGEAGKIRWPECNLLLVLRSVALWLLCFLAGPVVLAAGGFFYWLHCGDTDLLDTLILAELGVFAFGGWLLLVVAVSERGRILDANPRAVVRLINRVGDRLLVTALGAGVAAVVHGRLLLAGLEELHRRPELGWLLVAGCWLSGLFGMTFLLRLLGIWCHRAADSTGGSHPGNLNGLVQDLPH
jgi:hypothetical protein